MKDFISALEREFKANANPKIAVRQQAYLRDKFLFFGIKTPTRRVIQKPFLVKEHLPPKEDLEL